VIMSTAMSARRVRDPHMLVVICCGRPQRTVDDIPHRLDLAMVAIG